jgi:betaine-aldehyde dehydrogenase
MPSYDKLYIGGEWVAPSTSNLIEVHSPATHESVGTVPEAAQADVDAAVAAAQAQLASGEWSNLSGPERAEKLQQVNDKITERAMDFATVITNEVGSPISWGTMAQAYAPTMILGFYIDLIKQYEFEELRQGVMGNVLVRREPVGVVGGIVPWNVPLFTTIAKFAPALAAGNPIVLKPSPETPIDAFLLAEICDEVGLPAGLVNVVPGGRELGQYIVDHKGIDKISFTGSTAAGMKIAAACGEQLKRYSLELGGKSAAIILDDANLDELVAPLVDAGTMNNGEACVAQTRILAPRDRYDEVAEAIVEQVRTLKVGDPLEADTQIGPLIAERQRDRVEGYIQVGQEEGAKVAVGGGRPEGFDKGWYVEPTVFVNVDNSMRIAQEEIFGPVLSIIPYDSPEDAVKIANDSDYGLSGSVWSGDPQRGLDVARQVRTGTYTVNGFMMDFAAPFGGYKSSGIGREFGKEGLETFTELKSICLPAGFEPDTK